MPPVIRDTTTLALDARAAADALGCGDYRELYRILGERRAGILARECAALAVRMVRQHGTPDDQQALVGVEGLSVDALDALCQDLQPKYGEPAHRAAHAMKFARAYDLPDPGASHMALQWTINNTRCCAPYSALDEVNDAIRTYLAAIYVHELGA